MRFTQFDAHKTKQRATAHYSHMARIAELEAAISDLISLAHQLLPKYQQFDSTLDNLPQVITARKALRPE